MLQFIILFGRILPLNQNEPKALAACVCLVPIFFPPFALTRIKSGGLQVRIHITCCTYMLSRTSIFCSCCGSDNESWIFSITQISVRSDPIDKQDQTVVPPDPRSRSRTPPRVTYSFVQNLYQHRFMAVSLFRRQRLWMSSQSQSCFAMTGFSEVSSR